jgi:hypothetical protein
MRSIYIHTLLGNSEHLLSSSDEFAAFQQGFDLFLTPQIPSFVSVSICIALKCISLPSNTLLLGHQIFLKIFACYYLQPKH